MRVALVSMFTPHHEETGATMRMRRTAELLTERGHDVVVLCAKWWDGEVVEFEQNGVTYHRVTDSPASGRFASRVPFVLREVGPDVIQVTSYPPSHVTAAKTAARFLRVPVVADWWARDERGGSRSYRRAAKSPHAVLAPSEMVRTEVRELGASVDSTHVVPEPINMDIVREAAVETRADVVYARDLDEHANVESFLLALAELRDKDWDAVVVGDGPERADAEQTARDLRIDDRVEFLGELSANEAVPILKGAHVFAQTATVEPFATNLLWALACGCVSIVEYQAHSAAHELVEGRARGSLVTSPQELADEIVAARGFDHQTVDDEFATYDYTHVIDQYESVYEAEIDDYGFF
ncbi:MULTISPECIES: glycosyltransferase family 4 protein [Haloferax]|uniref:Glycosyltransferase n=1 Tax=Haloferax marinum TaxID=2666143 RepID=A0A6A8G4R2_9EURY|nr:MULTISPECIES: glycosyltransferase family 4 protein [Haloferax]KAB1196950.1 glycosyltransferase family 4 protein [Haloferax sp. CBA1150]MRW95969.1 glycosyltransferase [Haloferax marinum]